MRAEHKVNVLIVKDKNESVVVCEKVLKERGGSVFLYTGEGCVVEISEPAEVLCIADTGKCFHRFTVEG